MLTRTHVEESFCGDISGDGVAEFLQAVSADGSASFVGIGRVTGSVGARQETFLLRMPAPGDNPGRILASRYFAGCSAWGTGRAYRQRRSPRPGRGENTHDLDEITKAILTINGVARRAFS